MDRIKHFFTSAFDYFQSWVCPPSTSADHVGDVSDPNGTLAAQEAAFRSVVAGHSRRPADELAVEAALATSRGPLQADMSRCERIDLRDGSFGRLCPVLGRNNAWLFYNP